MTLSYLYDTPTIIALTTIWAYCAYRIGRRETKLELHLDLKMPIPLACAIALAALASTAMPKPWNLSMPLAIVGLGVAAWIDWHTLYLWDEIVVTTAILSGSAMLIGGQGNTSMAGGMLCATIVLVSYFVAQWFGAETGYGDVKHAAAIGFAIGPTGGAVAYFCAVLLVIIITVTLSTRKTGTLKLKRGVPIPFGPALTLGLLVAAATLHQIYFLQSLLF